MDTAEYFDANSLLKEPTFKWWANKVLKKNNRIIYRFKSRYCRTSHNLGIFYLTLLNRITLLMKRIGIIFDGLLLTRN